MDLPGHSQITVTMHIHTHVVQDTQREAVSHMDRLLKSRPRSQMTMDIDVRRGHQRPPTKIGRGPSHWWARTVSNRRHLLCKSSALPLSYAPG